MTTVAVTAQFGSLAQRLKTTGSETSIAVLSKEPFTSVSEGVLKVNTGTSREWIYFAGTSVSGPVNGVYTITFTGCVRGLDKDAVTSADASNANKQNHAVGVPVAFVFHSMNINDLISGSGDNTFTGDNTVTGSFTFSSTTHGTLRLQNVTSAQRVLLTGLQDGVILYDTTTDEPYIYAGGAWYALSTGSIQPNATESVKGIVQLGTVSDQQNATVTGSTGAGTVVQTRYLVQTSSGAADAYKILILDANGKLPISGIPSSVQNWGGTGADGSQSGALTIAGSNDTYIQKNYTSMTPGSNTVTVTPTGCVVHLRVQGNANLQNATFDFDGKGAAGGAGGAGANSGSGNPGVDGSQPGGFINLVKPGNDNGAPAVVLGSSADPGTGGVAKPIGLTFLQGSRQILVYGGSGGGGGAGARSASLSGAGGTGGAGGGCLILEVAGDINLTGTTFNFRGNAGSPGVSGSGVDSSGGGGGGGGGGGSFVILYNGTLTGSPTVNITGGAGGAAGSAGAGGSSLQAGGGGGGGGASISTSGSTGSFGNGGSAPQAGGAGGTGGNGTYLIEQNTVFQ